MLKQPKFIACVAAAVGFLTLGHPADAADARLVANQRAWRQSGPDYFWLSGTFGSWSVATGRFHALRFPYEAYPPYSGARLPTGYRVSYYDRIPPYCTWVTRRTNGYGGQVLLWPLEVCH
jgi:hypothetical protein